MARLRNWRGLGPSGEALGPYSKAWKSRTNGRSPKGRVWDGNPKPLGEPHDTELAPVAIDTDKRTELSGWMLPSIGIV